MNSRINLIILLVLFSEMVIAGASNSTVSNNNNYSIAINLSAEMNNSYVAGFNFTQSYFSSKSALDCQRVLITACYNNVPDQFVCINNAHYNNYIEQSRNVILRQPQACPEFILAGTVSCAVQNDSCVVTYSSYTYPVNATVNSTSNSTSTSGNSILNGIGSFLGGVFNAIVAFFKSVLHLG